MTYREFMPIIALFSAAAGPLQALPAIDHISHGTAHPAIEGNELRIEASDNAILHFRKFDIEPHETVRFQMAEASHRVLNRINGSAPSLVKGKLFSNGIVYLMNPAGFLFGPSSLVNVGALYVAAAHLSDSDFLQGIDHFKEVQGSIEIQGTLLAEDIALVGKTVLQNGTVLAEEGHVIYATADHVYLQRENSHLSVKCERDSLQEAADIPCFFACGSPEAFFLHHAGSSKAKRIHVYAEQESLVKISGTLDASKTALTGQGGDVWIQGEVISLERAKVEASGAAGGGEILIGGGAHGKSLYPTAKYLECDSNTSIIADATLCGDGGGIVLWADRGLIFDGQLYARGGPQGGNGGAVETSCSGHFIGARGKVSTAAPQGRLGQWLIDPFSIQIGNQPYTVPQPSLATLADASDSGVYLIDPGPTGVLSTAVSSFTLAAVNEDAGSPGSQNIQLGYLNNAPSPTPVTLSNPNAGVAVNFNTVNPSDLSVGSFSIFGTVDFDGDLTFNANTTLLGDTTIISRSGGITFNGFLVSSPPGAYSITLSAQNDIDFNGTVGAGTVGFSNFNIQNAANVTFAQIASAGGPASSIDLTNNFTAENSFDLSGNLNITASQGNIIFQNLLQCQPNILSPSNSITLTADAIPGQTISFTAPAQTVTIAGSATASGDIGFAGPVLISNPMSMTSTGGGITFSNTVQSSAPTTPFPLTLSAAGAIIFTGNVGSANFSDFTITQAALATFMSQAMLNGSITTTGDVTFTGTLFPVGDLSITSTSGNIFFNNTTSALTGMIGLAPLLTLSAEANILFRARLEVLLEALLSAM